MTKAETRIAVFTFIEGLQPEPGTLRPRLPLSCQLRKDRPRRAFVRELMTVHQTGQLQLQRGDLTRSIQEQDLSLTVHQFFR